jgi:predicted dehydrogenase
MRIALVGLGDIAQKAYLPLLASDERVTPLLCTRNPAVLTSWPPVPDRRVLHRAGRCWQAALMR